MQLWFCLLKTRHGSSLSRGLFRRLRLKSLTNCSTPNPHVVCLSVLTTSSPNLHTIFTPPLWYETANAPNLILVLLQIIMWVFSPRQRRRRRLLFLSLLHRGRFTTFLASHRHCSLLAACPGAITRFHMLLTFELRHQTQTQVKVWVITEAWDLYW